MKSKDKIVDPHSLPIPIYLNQITVFDLLAVVEDWFSQLRRVETSETDAESRKNSTQGEAGVSNILGSVLKLSLKGSRSTDTSASATSKSSEERVFTPTSLFSKLRDILIEEDLVTALNPNYDLTTLNTGTFIEFEAVLHRNPAIAAFEAMVQIFEMERAFETSTPTSVPRQRGQRQQGRSNQNRDHRGDTFGQMHKFLEILTQSRTVDLIAELPDSRLQAVIPVEEEYLLDKTSTSIIDAKFTVLGKVVRVVPSKEAGSVSLLRGTGLHLIPDVHEFFKEIFEDLESDPDLNMPEVKTQIPGPAIQVIPICIYA